MLISEAIKRLTDILVADGDIKLGACTGVNDEGYAILHANVTHIDLYTMTNTGELAAILVEKELVKPLSLVSAD